ncbi:enoyl-CoA hydratase-related protein [Piscinibacter koreensis]|uniref:Enoyl-CoA hydratase/isomerase family protein n=1 Tax=Piscinibacter koreensis TaxID=2742824 RepID=A0A7Y6NMU8_9BURK|nr:enoyl-CoA hydratase-related protein [Schlegelella koreensis]NUZ06091.1 enoyl-CoA hydratase/isomerase family protein [Schlegelella koreensis]
MPPSFETLRWELDGPVLTITLDRADHMNAMTRTMRRELCRVLDLADGDDAVRAVVFTGAGTRAFCAGFDLAGGPASFDPANRADDAVDEPDRDGGGVLALRLFASTKPLIAAVNGAAVGIGAAMTLPMDLRIAADGARFGFVYARRGIVPDACASWFLPRVVGIGRALEWSLSGRLVTGAEALAGGLVQRLVPADELRGAARAAALEIAENTAPVSVALTRQLMWRMLGANHPMAAHRLESRLIAERGASADAREGVAAFAAKRKPAFEGRVSEAFAAPEPWRTDPPFGACDER